MTSAARLAMLVAALFAAGCNADSIESKAVGKGGGVTVELLFEHEGVRVYRFHDGRYHYYAVPMDGRPAQLTDAWSQQSGKTSVSRSEEIPTLER